MTIKNQYQTVPVKLILCHENGKHRLEIRKKISDLDIIKNIISCAFNEQPIIVMPVFTDKIRSINTLIEKGIIVRKVNRDNSTTYDFLI